MQKLHRGELTLDEVRTAESCGPVRRQIRGPENAERLN